ncbi:dephospho-CoA kinase [Luteimonas fraxinea]|uniref:Dephospho-CoA kinase n=1 Tax=Luteimonas fraxinea TaxID=2901869 RepID=A0ABS8UA76_9GAMM|nr:dephospho-CoA kinase [Luteimonas fraxinea]MCD9095792.1 dephospho-CoA kinase [Luteimonas fraxinea]UHH11025.1 dephospho-CoA kinase [Luteimonas fraxinea]
MSVLIIGLTGGIASGKTAATQAFERRGIVVADADLAAREAVAPGSTGLAAVVDTFGADALAEDGSLDRAAMRRRIFEDPQARVRLEAIIHPRVRAALRAACEAAPGPYAVAAIPLLTEGGRAAYPWLHRVLAIDVPRDLQLARLLARDGIDEILAERMVAAQVSREARLAIADDVIVNDGTLEALDAAVDVLDGTYRGMAASGS